MMGMIATYATEININQTDSGWSCCCATRISLLVSHSIFCAGRGQEGVEKEMDNIYQQSPKQTRNCRIFLSPLQMWLPPKYRATDFKHVEFCVSTMDDINKRPGSRSLGITCRTRPTGPSYLKSAVSHGEGCIADVTVRCLAHDL